MWNKFSWIWKIRMGYILPPRLVLYVCVVLFIFDRDPSSGRLTQWVTWEHESRMVTDIIFIIYSVYPGTRYYHNLSQLQWKYTQDTNVYPDFIDEDPNLLLLQPADLLQPLLLELIWLEDLDISHRGAQDPALVVLDVLGQLVIPESDSLNF